jgi:hypothetical protein
MNDIIIGIDRLTDIPEAVAPPPPPTAVETQLRFELKHVS